MNYKDIIDETTYLKNFCDDMLGYTFESDIYNHMFNKYKQENFEQVEELFNKKIKEMTEIAFKNEKEFDEVELIIFNYLTYLENLHFIIGYKLACKLNK